MYTNFKLTNCVQVDEHNVQFDVYVTNVNANQSLKLNSAQFGVNMNDKCLAPGTTLTNSYVEGSSEVIPPTAGWNMIPFSSNYPTSSRFAQSPTPSVDSNGNYFCNQAPVLTLNVPKKLGTFNLQSTLGFVAGQAAGLTLQDKVATGKTICAAVLYVGANQSTTSTNATTITVTNDCQLTF